MVMKKPRKVTRVKLRINQINEFILIGLVTSEPDYRLSLSINRKFHISLKNTPPVSLNDDSGNELHFSRFSDSTGSPDKAFNLTCNRSGNHFLIRKLKNIDYIFHIQDPDNEAVIANMITGLKEIPGITAVFNIEPETLNDKNLHYVIQ
jgi:hypothetical protein